jgi:asparagine synthase (glutamine-hydrolysing)
MCGITAILSHKGIDHQTLMTMTDSLSHRGPDGYGYMIYSEKTGRALWHNQDIESNHSDDNIGFGHRRLAIIDLSDDGLQPMGDTSGSKCITYNGEIYNFKEIKEELQKLGYIFTTQTDTEVILYAYTQWGEACVQRFNGMWAFIIHDAGKNQVFISRDRFGIKPLYYTNLNENLYFASEIKAFKRIPGILMEPNEEVVQKYLLNGIVDDSDETFYKNIFRFPSSSYALIDLSGKLSLHTITRYWSYPLERYAGSEEDAVQTFRDLFKKSLSLHMTSDVPVGSCLSGGLDSSSIVCGVLKSESDASNVISIPYQCFCYLPQDERQSEFHYMEFIRTGYLVSLHYCSPSIEEIMADIPHILHHQDEPFASPSLIAQWFVCKEAAKTGIPVLLDGQGADELLGGYLPYLPIRARELVKEGNWSELCSMIWYCGTNIKFMTRSIHDNAYADRNSFFRWVVSVLWININNCLHPRVSERLDSANATLQSNQVLKPGIQCNLTSGRNRGLNEQLCADLLYSRLPALLRYEDRNAMAHSIESRVPFLDSNLVEFVATLPSVHKIYQGRTKHLLRAAMQGIIPEGIRERKDKTGFRADSSIAFLLVELDPSLLDNVNEFEKRWFETDDIFDIFYNHHISGNDARLWRIVNIKYWVRNLEIYDPAL